MIVNWKRWCRLCASYEDCENFVNCENYTFTIEKHFAIALSGPALHICSECIEFVKKVDEFGKRCRKVDELFTRLIFSDESEVSDVNFLTKLRNEFNLDAQKNIKKRHALKECSVELVDIYASEKNQKTRNCKKETGANYEPDIDVNIADEVKFEEVNFDSDIDYDYFYNDPVFGNDQDESSNEDENGKHDIDYMPIKTKKNKKLKNAKKSNKKQPKKSESDAPIEKTIKICVICDTEFENRALYCKHMRRNHPQSEKPFTCSECLKRFTKKDRWERHKIVHLPEQLKWAHSCEFCGKRFSQLINMKSHIRHIHTNERPFTCEECGRSFSRKTSLKEHQMTHADEYPYKCTKCPKKFKFIASLRTHEDTHTDKKYNCTECHAEVCTKDALRKHMLLHSDKTYTCNYCEKTYKSKSALMGHVIAHSEEKKFKCKICDKTFKKSYTLKQHYFDHAGLQPYTCPFCQQTFSNITMFRTHKKKMHQVELAAAKEAGQELPKTFLPKIKDIQPMID